MTEDGHAKYWKASSFAYAGDDRDFPCDKFFPEEVKQFCIKELPLVVSAELEEIYRVIECMKKNNASLVSPDTMSDIMRRDNYFFNLALDVALEIIRSRKGKK